MAFSLTLQFSTDDQRLVELCRRYWALDSEHFRYKVTEISTEFDVPSSQLSKLVGHCSTAFSTEYLCSRCNTAYVFSNRSDFQIRNAQRPPWVCPECTQKEAELKESERILAIQRYRGLIQERYGSGNPGPITPETLSLESAVFLLSFTRLLAVEDFSSAQSLESVKRRISPTHAMDLEVIRALYKGGLISVSSNSPVDAFEGESAEKFYLPKVQWHLPLGTISESPKDFASELEETLRGDNWPPEWCSSGLSLWKKVALNECLQYLSVALGEHGFALRPGEKTILIFNALLETYSVAQIYNLIWRAAKDAAAFYVRGGVTKNHAANTVVGAMQRYGEHGRAEGWTVKPFRRHFDCPQSMISEVLYNVVLRVGDDGFNRVPDKARLAHLPRFSVMSSVLVQ